MKINSIWRTLLRQKVIVLVGLYATSCIVVGAVSAYRLISHQSFQAGTDKLATTASASSPAASTSGATSSSRPSTATPTATTKSSPLTKTSSSAGQSGKSVPSSSPTQTTTPPSSAPSSTPPSQTINCAPNPHLCGYPDATNTGIPAGTVLKRVPQDITAPDATTGSGWYYDSRGWIEVSTAGAVIQNIDTSMNIDVTANNVTVKNVRIHENGDSFGVSLRHTTNAIVENSEIYGGDTGANRLLVGVKDIYGDAVNTQVLSNNIYHVSTGVQMDTGLIQDNYIHDMGYISGDHINGTTSNGGSTAKLTIQHNTSFNQFGQTDAISLFEDFGVQTNKVINNNLVAGGGYCIYGGQNSGGAATSNITITNNRFARLYYPNCGYYGPLAAWSSGGGNVWSGNVWDDTNATVSP